MNSDKPISELTNLELEIVQLRNELEKALLENERIIKSRSWAMTSPLRFTVSELRKIKSFIVSVLHLNRGLTYKEINFLVSLPWQIPNILYLIYLKVQKKIKIIREDQLPQKKMSIEDFWREAHDNDLRRWITGSSPTDELGYLGVLNDLRGHISYKILVVGVGTGSTANYLSRRGHIVDVLDITTLAFEKLSPAISERHLVNNYSLIERNNYDYVIHFLVAQHMTDKELENQVEVLIDSLRIGGRLKMQFASSLVDSNNNFKSTLTSQKKGEILRSFEHFNELMKSFKNIEFNIESKLSFPNWEEGWCWYLLSATRTKETS